MSYKITNKITNKITDKITIEEKIQEFWEKDVWKSNVKHIHNERIKDVLSQIQKLIISSKPNKKFYLMTDGELKIKTNPKIEIQIDKLKRDNLIYIKTHADSIPEYHNLIIEHKKKSLFLSPNS
jgi:hypothetical protein